MEDSSEEHHGKRRNSQDDLSFKRLKTNTAERVEVVEIQDEKEQSVDEQQVSKFDSKSDVHDSVEPEPVDSGQQLEGEQQQKQQVLSMSISSLDAAFMLGRGGRTKQKICAVSGCMLNLRGDMILEFIGTPDAQERARLYVDLVIQQRKGPMGVSINLEGRTDVTAVPVPDFCVAFVTGHHGAVLRRTEEDWGTLMFFVRREQNEEPKDSKSDHLNNDRDSTIVDSVKEESTKEEQEGIPQPESPNNETINDETSTLPTSAESIATSQGETLLIFGPERARKGAELKVMSAIEQKLPGHFADALEDSQDLSEGVGRDIITINSADFSYALGRDGSTRRKLAAASGAILEYVGHKAVLWGTKIERDRVRDYLTWLIQQRTGSVGLSGIAGRDDVTLVGIPRSVYTRMGGVQGLQLRRLEVPTKTFCFMLKETPTRAKAQQYADEHAGDNAETAEVNGAEADAEVNDTEDNVGGNVGERSGEEERQEQPEDAEDNNTENLEQDVSEQNESDSAEKPKNEDPSDDVQVCYPDGESKQEKQKPASNEKAEETLAIFSVDPSAREEAARLVRRRIQSVERLCALPGHQRNAQRTREGRMRRSPDDPRWYERGRVAPYEPLRYRVEDRPRDVPRRVSHEGFSREARSDPRMHRDSHPNREMPFNSRPPHVRGHTKPRVYEDHPPYRFSNRDICMSDPRPRGGDSHIPDLRMTDPRIGDSRMADARMADARMADSRMGDSRMGDSRMGDSRMGDSRMGDSRMGDSRMGDSRMGDSRIGDARMAGRSRRDDRYEEGEEEEEGLLKPGGGYSSPSRRTETSYRPVRCDRADPDVVCIERSRHPSRGPFEAPREMSGRYYPDARSDMRDVRSDMRVAYPPRAMDYNRPLRSRHSMQDNIGASQWHDRL